MKPILKYCSLTVIALGLVTAPLWSGGCATPNPNAGQVTITTNGTTISTNVAPAYLPNATATQVISALQAANTASAPFNPYATIIATILGLTSLGLGYVANAKNQQANGLNSQLTAVIQGVETATAQPTVTGPAVKAAIKSAATAAGVQSALNTKVQAITTS